MKQTSIIHNQVDLGTPVMEPQRFLKRNRLSKYKLLTRFCVSEIWLTLDTDTTKTKGQIQCFFCLFVCLFVLLCFVLFRVRSGCCFMHILAETPPPLLTAAPVPCHLLWWLKCWSNSRLTWTKELNQRTVFLNKMLPLNPAPQPNLSHRWKHLCWPMVRGMVWGQGISDEEQAEREAWSFWWQCLLKLVHGRATLTKKVWEVGLMQTGEEKALGRPLCSIPVLEGSL